MTTHGKLKVKEKLYFYSNFSMNTFKDNQKFRKALKYFSVLTLMNLLYLNVFRPLKLSFDQLFLIVLAVVNVCNERGVDVYTLSPDQLDEIIALSINAIRQVFKENGLRFIPNFSRSAYAIIVIIFLIRSIVNDRRFPSFSK